MRSRRGRRRLLRTAQRPGHRGSVSRLVASSSIAFVCALGSSWAQEPPASGDAIDELLRQDVCRRLEELSIPARVNERPANGRPLRLLEGLRVDFTAFERERDAGVGLGFAYDMV